MSHISNELETANEWINLWIMTCRLEGKPINYQEGCIAWFRMQDSQKSLDK